MKKRLANRYKTAMRKRAMPDWWQDDTVVYRVIVPCVVYGDHGKYLDGSRYDPSAIVRVSPSGHIYGHIGFDENMQFSSIGIDKELTGMTWPEIKDWCREEILDEFFRYENRGLVEQIGDFEVLTDATDYVYLDQWGLGTIMTERVSRKRKIDPEDYRREASRRIRGYVDNEWEDMYDPDNEVFIKAINDEYDAFVTTWFDSGTPYDFNKYSDLTEWQFYIQSNLWNEIVGEPVILGEMTFDDACLAANKLIDEFVKSASRRKAKRYNKKRMR